MKKIVFMALFVFPLFFVPVSGPMISSAENEEVLHRHTMDKVDNWVAIFEEPKRVEWQEPDKVIKMMNLKRGDVVADIGAGSGYFTRRFARAVGPEGKAFGVDIEPELVKYMEGDARRANVKSYIPALGTMADSGLEPGSVDVVFLCLTYHHIEDRVNYMRNLKKVLKKGGRIIFVEFYKKKMDFGPPPSHKDAKEKVMEELKEAGYRLTRSLDFLRYQYFLEFESAT